ncbi:MAG: hypothetical protein SFV81_12515 [Pirellulaceae bacterium]|nr:hypothetical protein [Pirellulaceae bacterium]
MDLASEPMPVFVGLRYVLHSLRPRDWCRHPQTEHVTEICSVSTCIASGPKIWFEGFGKGVHWSSEDSIATLVLMDAAEQAELVELGVLGANECYAKDQLSLCAYRIFPSKFTRAASPVALESSQLFAAEYALPLPEPDWSRFERLGYDVVQLTPIQLLDVEGVSRAGNSLAQPSYGCSPLSCNGLACHHPVNRYCLLDSHDAAFEAAQVFGREEPEPGPFVIVEVLRQYVKSEG